MTMTDIMKTAILESTAFQVFLMASLTNAITSVLAEDSATENHVKRYALAKVIQTSSTSIGGSLTSYNFIFGLDVAVVNNQNISFDSIQTDYNTAILAEWDNIANNF